MIDDIISIAVGEYLAIQAYSDNTSENVLAHPRQLFCDNCNGHSFQIKGNRAVCSCGQSINLNQFLSK